MAMVKNPRFHIVMYPWSAFGHMIPYLHLSNELAERGHSITFILPKKVQSQLQHLNLHPTLISFHSLTIPYVDGLPPGAETASDVPISLHHLLATAMDRTTDQVEAALRALKSDFLFYDTAYWAPPLASKLGMKPIFYTFSYCLVLDQQISKSRPIPTGPPPGYPSSTVVLRPHEARLLQFLLFPFGEDITFHERLTAAIKLCDVVSIRTCQEIEGPFCDYIERRWAQWLSGFKPGSVIFCAFGSQNFPGKDQFQELLLGFELTGLPFLAALKPPLGAATIEEALPEGFQERVGGRGVVYGGWVPQPSILSHPSVGCFVSHCGFGSMWESLMSDPQIVLVPELFDQTFNARLLAEELKVAVEVEKEENGWVSKEGLCKAIKSVMDEEGEVGCLVKKNHAKWKETLMSQGFMSNYIDNFVRQLLDLK
ncbi:unnamed protein product, partial [Vitis vinifera]